MNQVERIARSMKHRLGLKDSSWVVTQSRPLFDAFLGVAFATRGLPRVVYGGEKLRLLPKYRHYHDDFEPCLIKCVREHLREGQCVFEVGANIGFLTVLLSKWVGPAGKVYAFEPAPTSRAALQRHLAMNGTTERVVVRREAVSEFEGQASFYVDGASGENTLSNSHWRIPRAKNIQVPVVTLDSFCRSQSIEPDLIKIDVEGFEYQVLAGCVQTLIRARPRIVVELHPTHWLELGTTESKFTRLLDQTGYRYVALEEQKNAMREYGHVLLEPVHRSAEFVAKCRKESRNDS
jgi:FkbM family methyltransferase